jgi:hypothetical protein
MPGVCAIAGKEVPKQHSKTRDACANSLRVLTKRLLIGKPHAFKAFIVLVIGTYYAGLSARAQADLP